MTGGFDHAPIFLGGVAGAGKTRLGSLLNRHPHIAVTRRTYLWRNFYGRYGDLSEPRNLHRCVSSVLSSPGVRALDLDPDLVWTAVSEGDVSYARLFAVIHGLHARQVNKPRWCDQLGLVEMYADTIFASYPTAKMIHMVCDPRSLPRPAGPPGTVGWMVGKWLTSAEHAERNTHRFGDRYLVLRQEDFQADEHAVLEEVCAFVDEPFEPGLMLGQSADRPSSDASTIVRESSARGVDPFVAVRTARAVRLLGYESSNWCRSPSLRDRLVDRPANTLALALWQRIKAHPGGGSR